MRKLSLSYLHCPDCESSEIIFNGKSSIGTQKHRCKQCGHQFVCNFDALFPRSYRRELFEREFLENLSATGFEKGSGKKKYWAPALAATLAMIESHRMQVRWNRTFRNTVIHSDREYQVLVEWVVHEAYLMAMNLPQKRN